MATPARRSPKSQQVRNEDAAGEGTAPESDATLADQKAIRNTTSRRLHTAKETRLPDPATPNRWSRRRTLAFILVNCCLLWGTIIAAITGIVRLLAG